MKTIFVCFLLLFGASVVNAQNNNTGVFYMDPQVVASGILSQTEIQLIKDNLSAQLGANRMINIVFLNQDCKMIGVNAQNKPVDDPGLIKAISLVNVANPETQSCIWLNAQHSYHSAYLLVILPGISKLYRAHNGMIDIVTQFEQYKDDKLNTLWDVRHYSDVVYYTIYEMFEYLGNKSSPIGLNKSLYSPLSHLRRTVVVNSNITSPNFKYTIGPELQEAIAKLNKFHCVNTRILEMDRGFGFTNKKLINAVSEKYTNLSFAGTMNYIKFQTGERVLINTPNIPIFNTSFDFKVVPISGGEIKDNCPNQLKRITETDIKKIQNALGSFTTSLFNSGNSGFNRSMLSGVNMTIDILEAMTKERIGAPDTVCPYCVKYTLPCIPPDDPSIRRLECVAVNGNSTFAKDIFNYTKEIDNSSYGRKKLLHIIPKKVEDLDSGAFLDDSPLNLPGNSVTLVASLGQVLFVPNFTSMWNTDCDRFMAPMTDPHEMRMLSGKIVLNGVKYVCSVVRFHPDFFKLERSVISNRSDYEDIQRQYTAYMTDLTVNNMHALLSADKSELIDESADFQKYYTTGIRPQGQFSYEKLVITATGAIDKLSLEGEFPQELYASGNGGEADASPFKVASPLAAGIEIANGEINPITQATDIYNLITTVPGLIWGWLTSKGDDQQEAVSEQKNVEESSFLTKLSKFGLEMLTNGHDLNSPDDCEKAAARTFAVGNIITTIGNPLNIVKIFKKPTTISITTLGDFDNDAIAAVGKHVPDPIKQQSLLAAFNLKNYELPDLESWKKQFDEFLKTDKVGQYLNILKEADYKVFVDDVIKAGNLDFLNIFKANPKLINGWGALKDLELFNSLSTTLRKDPDALKRLTDDLADPELLIFMKTKPKGLDAWNYLDKADPKRRFKPCPR